MRTDIDHNAYKPAAWRIDDYLTIADGDADDDIRGHVLTFAKEAKRLDGMQRSDDVDDLVVRSASGSPFCVAVRPRTVIRERALRPLRSQPLQVQLFSVLIEALDLKMEHAASSWHARTAGMSPSLAIPIPAGAGPHGGRRQARSVEQAESDAEEAQHGVGGEGQGLKACAVMAWPL